MSFEHNDSEIAEGERGAAREAFENEDEPTPGLAEAGDAYARWAAAQPTAEVDAALRRHGARRAAEQQAADDWMRAHGWVRGFDGIWRER